MDLLQDRSEAKALEQVCKIIGHEVAVLSAYSKSDLEKYCKYISSINTDNDKPTSKIPLCIHLSAHGNTEGVGFGSDFLKWEDLFETMKPLFTEIQYEGKVILSISSCQAGNQDLSRIISQERKYNHDISPPNYILVTADPEGVSWDDALVSWTLFYHKIAGATLDRVTMQRTLDTVKSAVGTDLKYFRWTPEKKRYRRYTGKP